MHFDPYILFLLALGVVVLLVSWLPMALRKLPLSLAMSFVPVSTASLPSGPMAASRRSVKRAS